MAPGSSSTLSVLQDQCECLRYEFSLLELLKAKKKLGPTTRFCSMAQIPRGILPRMDVFTSKLYKA